jgi:hypothetical protein
MDSSRATLQEERLRLQRDYDGFGADKNSPRILADEPLVDWGSDETTKFFAISKNWWT